MPEKNIIKEIEELQNIFDDLVKLHCIDNPLGEGTETFGAENFLLTFPYNFSTQPDDLIRKLAVINYCYGVFFMCEDKLIDDYNDGQNDFRKLIINMLNSHNLKNHAVGELLNLCGQEIYQYLFDYEEKYYKALVFEKKMNDIPAENMLDENNLLFLGHKLMPMCLTFAAYCILKNKRENIKVCEELITNYHIGKQIIDDLKDITSDLQKPDLSFLILLCKKIDDKIISRSDVIYLLREETILKEYIKSAYKHILIAELKAEELEFYFLLKEICEVKKRLDYIMQKI